MESQILPAALHAAWVAEHRASFAGKCAQVLLHESHTIDSRMHALDMNESRTPHE